MNTFTFLDRRRLDYTWPHGGSEVYVPSDRYQSSPLEIRLTLGYATRVAYGRERRRVVVFDEPSLDAIIELAGCDDFDESWQVIWPMKQPGGNAYQATSSSPHAGYSRFEIVPFNTRISGPPNSSAWGVVLNEGDAHGILELAMIRRSHRHNIEAV